jgi:hypothetical protein
MAPTSKLKRAPVRAKTKAKVVCAKTTRTSAVRRFKVGDRVLFTYGQREVEGTVTSILGDHLNVDMHFTSEPAPGLFRESELRSA